MKLPMAKKKSSKKKSASKRVDSHFFSALVGLVLGTSAFYAKRAFDSRSATA